MVVQTCNPSMQGAEEEDLEFNASLSYMVRPYLKKKK
jgi:hypothetical protein